MFAVILLKTMDKNYNNPPRRSDTFEAHQLALMSILSKYGEWKVIKIFTASADPRKERESDLLESEMSRNV